MILTIRSSDVRELLRLLEANGDKLPCARLVWYGEYYNKMGKEIRRQLEANAYLSKVMCPED